MEPELNQSNSVSFPEKAATPDQGATNLGIALNVLYAAAGVVSAVIYGKNVYVGVKSRIGK